MHETYGISCLNELTPSNSHGASFFPSFCRIHAGGSTQIHGHYETEIFLIIRGNALAIVKKKEILLAPNDQLLVHPFEEHIIKNIGHGPLEFFSVYSRVNRRKDAQNINSLIISAPPTPNGRLHLGHLSGPYLSSDILKRFLLLKKRSTKHFCATDDHQTYTVKMARDLETTPDQISEKYHKLISCDFEQASIQFDDFLHPSKDEDYKNYIKNKFKKLKRSKAVTEKNMSFPTSGNYAYEAFLQGTCPKCKIMMTGQCCEVCGYVGEASDFNTKNLIPYKSLVFDLGPFEDFLKKYHFSLNLKGKVAIRAREWRQNLRPFTLNYPESIGISGIHVWCEMAFGLLYQRSRCQEKIDELVYCFGIDNAFYYLILIPAILKVLGEEEKLPQRVIINDFYYLDGHKFSTSRKHAIWVNDINKEDWDYLRLYLSLNRSEDKIGNFTLQNFQDFSKELKEKLGKLNILEKTSPNIKKITIGMEGRNFYQKMVHTLLILETSMSEDFSLNKYATESIKLLNDYLSYTSFSEDTLSEKIIFIPLIKMAFYPIMPNLFDPKDFANIWDLDLRRSSNEK